MTWTGCGLAIDEEGQCGGSWARSEITGAAESYGDLGGADQRGTDRSSAGGRVGGVAKPETVENGAWRPTAMFMARITGSIVSSQKVESMVGQKLLIVEPVAGRREDSSETQSPPVAPSSPSTRSEPARAKLCCASRDPVPGSPNRPRQLPIDAAIVGIVDQVQIGDQTA